MEYPFNGCTGNISGICADTIDKNKSKHHRRTEDETYNRDTHRFIDEVTDKEVKNMNVEYDAVLYHNQVFRHYNKAGPSVNMTKLNEYAEFYYPQVAAALRKRQLDLLIDIPSTKYRESSLASSWPTYTSLYRSRKKYGTLIP